MFRELLQHPTSLLFAVAVHAVLIVMLMFSFDWAPEPESASNRPDVIKAVAVDASKVEAELEKIRAAESRKKQQEQARINKLKRDAEAARKKRAAEEQRIADLKKKRAAEERKRKAEEQRLAALKKQQQQAEQKRAAEQKRLAEIERKRKLEEERKHKAEEARKKAEAEQRQREELERKRALAEQLAAEEQARADAAAVKTINEYTALIKNKVSRNWLKPAGNIKGLRCKVSVRLIPGGEVVSAQVIKSSGNSVFDRSVESAVFKASPLPLPQDPAIAARMREIDFEFIPEG